MKTSLIILILISISTVQPIRGCVCEEEPTNITDRQLRKALSKELSVSTVVFSGQVIQANRLEVKFKIERRWKGDLTDEVILLTGTKKINEQTYSSSSCDYHFKLGEKYLVYAIGKMNELITHACSRTKLLEQAQREVKILKTVIKARQNQNRTGMKGSGS